MKSNINKKNIIKLSLLLLVVIVIFQGVTLKKQEKFRERLNENSKSTLIYLLNTSSSPNKSLSEDARKNLKWSLSFAYYGMFDSEKDALANDKSYSFYDIVYVEDEATLVEFNKLVQKLQNALIVDKISTGKSYTDILSNESSESMQVLNQMHILLENHFSK